MCRGLKTSLHKFLRGRKIKCFGDEINRIRAYKIVDLGVRVIEVKQITGTVDKCDVLDWKFRNIGNRSLRERQRMTRMDQTAAAGYYFFPHINVYLLNNEYYVLDGNRRVAAAKTHGIEYLDAHVLEYIDRENTDAIKGSALRRQFEQETKIKDIELNHTYGYGTLLREILAFAGEKDIREKALEWFSQIFLPCIAAIQKSRLPTIYPELRVEDIFVVIANFYHEFMGGMPTESTPETLISGFMFARKIPQRRIYRIFPLRFLLSVLKKT